MPRFQGFIQPKVGWLWDQDDRYWVMVGGGATYDLAREDTLRAIRKLNRGKKDPVMYVISIRSVAEEVSNARD